MAQIEECPKCMRNNGIMEDPCDGQLFKQHPLFSQDPHPLQIIAYDEVKLCNPLGIRVKQHKLGIIFSTLGNIHPNFWSSLQVINSSVCAVEPVIEKYGIDQVLQPFIRTYPFWLHRGLA